MKRGTIQNIGFRITLCLATAFVSLNVSAQITDAYRSENAVVWYRFQETTGPILDSANPKFGPPANLEIVKGIEGPTGDYRRAMGLFEIRGTNFIRSSLPVDKLANECKKTNELTVELRLRNKESVKEKTNSDKVAKFVQPLRIFTYSSGLNLRNFTIGQAYIDSDRYVAAIENSSVPKVPESVLSGSLREPLVSNPKGISIPDEVVTEFEQRILITYKKGKATMFLSDEHGSTYVHSSSSIQMSGDFSTWSTGSHIVLGNENLGKLDATKDQQSTTSSDSDNRPWRGTFSEIAVYCKALSPSEVLGADKYQVKTNEQVAVDASVNINDNRKRAHDIYLRLTGKNIPIYENDKLARMERLLASGDPMGAAAIATAEDHAFLNVVVRDMAAKMSNREETIAVPLNDFTATFIGAVRDNRNAQTLLYDNYVYVARPGTSVPNGEIRDHLISNNHYEALGAGNYDLADVLVSQPQKLFDGKIAHNNPSPAGLLTTRQWMAAHAIAGTNRRLVEYAFRQFLCTPIERVADPSGSDEVVGRDIDRDAGGTNGKYETTCKACHTILDGFRPAFAYFTFSNGFTKTTKLITEEPAMRNPPVDENTVNSVYQMPKGIVKKMNHNDHVFAFDKGNPGTGSVQYKVTNENWINNAIYGSNKSTFQWTQTSGSGPAAFGRLISESKQFPRCMAQRVFASVCKREPVASDETLLFEAAQEFSKSQNYNMKYLFHRIVTSKQCLGG